MKKLLLLLLLVPLYSHADEMNLTDLSGGMWSYPSANKIPDNTASYIQNFYTDIEPMAVERNGYVKQDPYVLRGSQPISGMWSFVDSSKRDWSVRFSSQIFYVNLLNQIPTPSGLVSTNTVGEPSCVSTLGKFWCVDSTAPLRWFDGTSTGTVTTAPLGAYIVAWRSRLVIANLVNGISTLHFSADGDGTNWTIGGNATDPFVVYIGGANDGQEIRCIYGSYLDNMIIGRKHDLWSLSGFSQSDYAVRNISYEIGCTDNGTVQSMNGKLIFLSKRGIEEMTGTDINLISDPIKDIVDPISRNSNLVESWEQTTSADFDAGVSSHVSTSGDSVQLLTFTDTDNTVTEFDSGTKNNVTVKSNGAVYLSTSSQDVPGGDFEFPSSELWETYGTSLSNTPSEAAKHGSYFLQFLGYDGVDNSYKLFITGISTTSKPVGHSAYTYSYGPYTPTLTTFTQRSIAPNSGPSNLTGTYVRLLLVRTLNPTSVYAYSPEFLYNGDTITWWDYGINSTDNAVDYFQNGVSTITTGSFISRTFDTTVPSPLWKTGNISHSMYTFLNTGSSVTFQTQVSANGSLWDTAVAWTSVSGGTAYAAPTSASKRYIRYLFNINTSTMTYFIPYVVSVPISCISSTGTYASQVKSNVSPSAWKIFSPDAVDNGGTHSYDIRAQNVWFPATSSTYAWTSLIPFTTPTIPVGKYFQIRDNFTITLATQNPKLNGFTQSWVSGSVLPYKSCVYDQRYWLSYANQDSDYAYNNAILVRQRNGSWTQFIGLNAASFMSWEDHLYFGNSNSNGYSYLFDIGNVDDTSNIVSKIHYKSNDLGTFHRDKDFSKAYVGYLGNTSYSGDFTFDYVVDRSSIVSSLGTAGLNEGTGQVVAKFPFPIGTQPVQGREIQFQVTKSGMGDRLRLYDINLNYSVMEER